jgi:glycosyltransferase involved in cell wall biosynthesis
MPLPSVSVVIPTYRRRTGLTEVVSAIAADRYPSEIIVVVDGSDDGSMELLQELAASDRRLRPLWQENRGQGAARQNGVEHAGGDVVLLLDDDVIAGPGLARRHALAQSRVSDTLVVGYMPTIRPSRRQPGNFSTHLYADDYERACAGFEADPSSVITHLWAGNLSIRRSDALRVGLDSGPDFVRHEDQTFGLRCARAGLTAVFDRSLAARHAHVRDVNSFARQAWHQGESRRMLGQLYPDLVADPDPRTTLSPPVRAAVNAITAPATHHLAVAVLRGGTTVAGRAGLWATEMALGRLLRQVELVCGFEGRR